MMLKLALAYPEYRPSAKKVRLVRTTSAADMPSSTWMSVGMPRPSSHTVTLPSPRVS